MTPGSRLLLLTPFCQDALHPATAMTLGSRFLQLQLQRGSKIRDLALLLRQVLLLLYRNLK